MRSSNPALNNKTFTSLPRGISSDQTMTLEGTVNKTGILLFLVLISASWIWTKVFAGQTAILAYAMPAGIVALVCAIALVFKKNWAPALAPAYALAEGVLVGAVSTSFEMRFPGIVIQAVALTFGTAAALLVAYKSGYIKATENFKLGIAAATGGIFLFYLISFILSFFHIQVPYVHESGIIGIGFSLVVVTIAALNLVLDFDFIENGAEAGAPKYMEWYAAFGLVVTLIWLYFEFLRLLAKLNSRD